MKRIFFITGTDTGVGKTVLTVLLTRHLRARKIPVLAVKPFCSGGREDAEALCVAQSGEVPMDAINPWHFPAPLTPLLAARRERRQITRKEVLDFLRDAARGTGLLLIEGAGGLLSPLGDGYSARELISGLRAIPLVVCPNRLGAINQTLLVVGCLSRSRARESRVVLMQPARADEASRTNRPLLEELLGPDRLTALPRINPGSPALPPVQVRRQLDQLLT